MSLLLRADVFALRRCGHCQYRAHRFPGRQKREYQRARRIPGGVQSYRVATRICFLCCSLGLLAILASFILIPIPVSLVHRQFESEVNECMFKVNFCWSIVAFFWRRKWLSTPVFLPGKSQGTRSLVVLSPWDHKELDTT